VRPSDLAIRNTLVGSMMPPDQLMAAMLLRSSGDRFRGRVMGVRMLAVYGMPLGLLLAGVMIRQLGLPRLRPAIAPLGWPRVLRSPGIGGAIYGRAGRRRTWED
jgi:hypothetical protein